MPTEPAMYVGLMSGTSADGIDAALVRFDDEEGEQFELLAFESVAFPEGLREEIHSLCDERTGKVDQVCRLDAVLGHCFGNAALAVIESAGVSVTDIRGIGSHGQTVHHLPEEPDRFGFAARSTLQIGNASIIAEVTGIQTLSDFRSRDLALGGQGAPLVPIVDYLLFRSDTVGRVLVNIGGICNVTVLPAGCSLDDVMAFDTGPGNVIIDGLVTRISGGDASFDRDGVIAASAGVDRALLERLLNHPFFEMAPPKSTGREVFGPGYVEELLETGSDVENDVLVATATALTAESLAGSLRCFVPNYGGLSELYVSGGGAANPTLVAMVEKACPNLAVHTSSDLGLDADAKEAVAFALLAHRTLNGLPGNVPSATGARNPAVLGQITPGRIRIPG